jgi:aryl-alcohol dehydrogenase-like predicted oxidoreductase
MLTIKDLLLGLANTSTNYGRLRSNPLTAKTLNELWELGFTNVDSSDSYSNADNVLGQSGRRWKIQNKITLNESPLRDLVNIEGVVS